MIWKKVTIKTVNEACDVVTSVLFDNGICGAEIDDSLNLSKEDLDKMYVDIPVEKENDGIAYVSFYVSINGEKETYKEKKDVVTDTVDNSYIASTDNIFTKTEFDTVLENIKTELNDYKEFMDMGELCITYEELDDKIFLNKWKENFKSFDIGDISIIPNWDKDKEFKNDKLKIYIEPGSAFGTGKHSTTKLCVDALRKVINENNLKEDSSLLDVGCGSGILAIISKKLGVEKVNAIDVDSSIEENLKENIKLNFTDSVIKDKTFEYSFGNIIDDINYRNIINTKKYDIIVANILAPVIISLIDKVHIEEFLKNAGYFICSGIIAEKKANVIETFKNNNKLEVIEILEENEWVCIISKRR